MADSKISALAAVTSLAGTEEFVAAVSGASNKITAANIAKSMPGYEIGYDQITAAVNIGSTSESTPTTIISCSAHSFDGNPVLLTFYAPYVQNSSAGSNAVTVALWESGTEITRIIFYSTGAAGQIDISQTGYFRFTPTAGSHSYVIQASCANLTGTPQIGAGSGSGANYPPAFVRFTKV